MPWTQGTILHIGAHHLTLQEVRGAAIAGRGRTVAVNAVPGAIPPTVPGGPVLGQVPSYGASPAVPAYGPAPGHVPLGPPGYQHHPVPHAAARASKQAKKGSSSALWVILGLMFAGTVGVGLILLVAIFGRKDGANTTSATTTLMKEPREATVKFVWFSGKEGPTARGGASPERVRVGPNTSRVVSVGISEEFAGGSGDQWPASAIACTAAATAYCVYGSKRRASFRSMYCAASNPFTSAANFTGNALASNFEIGAVPD
jgi:hypothetical protein